jgi:hypothetical protein
MSQFTPIRLFLFALLVAPSIAAQAQQPNTPGETEKLCKEKCEKDCMGNDTPTERAECLKREKCSDRPACPTKGSGAWILLRNGMAEIQVKCADSDSTRQCMDVVRPIISSPVGGSSTGVIYATTSIKCGSTIYEVSTGNTAGNCSVAGPENGPRESAGCNDAPSGGNSASANCQTGCGATTGSGSCTIKSAQ